MGPRSVATKQDRNSCSGTSAGSRERSSWVGIPNYKRVLSHNQTKSSIYVSDTSRLVIRWDLVYKNMGQALAYGADPTGPLRAGGCRHYVDVLNQSDPETVNGGILNAEAWARILSGVHPAQADAERIRRQIGRASCRERV